MAAVRDVPGVALIGLADVDQLGSVGEQLRRAARIDLVVDATHPFARLISRHANLAAAEADPDVAKKIGPAYLKRMQSDIDHAVALVSGKSGVQHDKLALGAQVKELAEELLWHATRAGLTQRS